MRIKPLMPFIALCYLIIIGLIIQGCFIQDFNKSARMAAYKYVSPTFITPTQVPSSTSEITSQTITNEVRQYSNNSILQELLRQHQQWHKTPYVSGGTQKVGADCSGFVMNVYNESFHIALPRTTIAQMEKGKKIGGRGVKIRKLRAGDLLFFKTGRGLHGYHVGIYLENGDFMHLSTKGGAKIANLSNNYWKKFFKKAVRYLD